MAGEQLVALNRAGVRALAETAPLPDGRPHARDWLHHSHKHRTACNFVFSAMLRGLDHDPGWTELEIRAGVAPPELSLYQFRDEDGELQQKIPDLLLHGTAGAIWCEIGNSWRGAKDFRKLVSFLRHVFASEALVVEQVWFVATTPVATTVGKRLHAALSHSPDSGYPRQLRELDAQILKSGIAVFQLEPDLLQLMPISLPT